VRIWAAVKSVLTCEESQIKESRSLLTRSARVDGGRRVEDLIDRKPKCQPKLFRELCDCLPKPCSNLLRVILPTSSGERRQKKFSSQLRPAQPIRATPNSTSFCHLEATTPTPQSSAPHWSSVVCPLRINGAHPTGVSARTSPSIRNQPLTIHR
jgi:hypothetical protein